MKTTVKSMVYYSVMASKSYRHDIWEVKEGFFEYNNYPIEAYLYSIILNDYARFHNLIIHIANN
jgi:hypothetical protein